MKVGCSDILLYFNKTNSLKVIIHYVQSFFIIKENLHRKWIGEDHGLLKIRPNMTPTDFEKCRFCLFVGSSSDIMFIHSHILSYM